METIDLVTSIGTIVGIILGLYGAFNSWRANKRLDENDGLLFRVIPYSRDTSKEWRIIELYIKNELGNSIFIDEIRPMNFNRLIPVIDIIYDNGFFSESVYGEPQSSYKFTAKEISRHSEHPFEFKIPKDLNSMKLKIFYSYTTTNGLKKTNRFYEHIL